MATEKMILHFDYLPCINYSALASGIETCSTFIVENHDDKDWHDVVVTVKGEQIEECVSRIDRIEKGKSFRLGTVSILPDTGVLISFTEQVKTHFSLRITQQDELLWEKEYPLTLLAYEEWTGSAVMPELLSAFVVPAAPTLSRVLVNAARFMENFTGQSALDEYQTQDRNRVRYEVAAVYEALRSEGIVYSAGPESFEGFGQKVRLADRVLDEKLGNCLDTSLLMASCLEKIGINPILVVFDGHVLTGAWLTPSVYPQTTGDDASYLMKEMADGNNNLVLVETTCITSTAAVAFEEAVRAAQEKLHDERSFLYFIDVHRCRLAHITPLPQRLEENGRWRVVQQGVEHENATKEVASLNHYDLRLEDTGKELTKQQIWERKLLDFSLRNNLLNMRVGRSSVQFISFEIDHLEDHLQHGEDYLVMPCPGTKIQSSQHGLYDSLHEAKQHESLVTEFIGQNKLVSYLTETELQNALKYIYRTARTSLEENGANSLFLSLGILKWYETQKSELPRFAPILLVPVDIVRKTGNSFVIRKRDEDVFLNITLVEFLKQNFNLDLSALQKELPKDESGVDVRYVLTFIRRAILEKKKWDVLEESLLGLFSFNKFVMWNDIHTHADLLKESPMIASLMERRNLLDDRDEPIDARKVDQDSEPKDFAIPLDVDSSQFEAVVESGRGKSFILQGPPGTGKSQTITNMIANALFQGKRVLFVAEKMAALSVVQARLDKIGLGAFCLELHSNKATKKHFLQQMESVLNVAKIKQPRKFVEESDELFAERKSLISYMQAIHSLTDSGISIYDSLAEYLKLEGEEMDVSRLPRELLDADKMKRYCGHAEKLQAILQLIGSIKDHALNGLEPIDNRQATLEAIKTTLHDLKNTQAAFEYQLASLNMTYPFRIEDDEKDISWLAGLAGELLTTGYLNGRLTECADDERRVGELRQLVAVSKELEQTGAFIRSKCGESIFSENVGELKRLWDEIQMKWFLPRFFAKRGFLRRMGQHGRISEADVYPLLQQVKKWQEAEQFVSSSPTKLSSYFDDSVMNAANRWELMEGTLNKLPAIAARLNDYSRRKNEPLSRLIQSFTAAQSQGWTPFKTAFTTATQKLTEHQQRLRLLAEQLGGLVAGRPQLAEVLSRLDDWLQGYEGVKDWCLWVEEKRSLQAEGLTVIVGQLEEGLEPKAILDAFMKGIYHRIIVENIDKNPQLRTFNGLLFNQQVEKYKHDTKRFQELSKEVLYYQLAQHIPSAATASSEGSEVSILKRNINNGGRGTSIRAIIDSIPTLLPRLCPCMLMSPLSVAQFLDLGTEKFDLVIFDEASQMPTSEAVGAIARGKALIVVGDSKQMPPTSFFTSTQVDEENADIDDMESILDDCNTLSMKEYQLNWHYRSKHESLIAFSNMQYYDNHLLTFPSVDDKDVKVRMVRIDGTYDKGRTRSNPDEAKAIVEEVVRRLKDSALRERSIGIISFSKVQQNLIEDMLYEELDKNAELKEIATNSKEPLFVKNLENVQGDERDVILFSVGYGPDKYGKVSMNFGPLNNAGGERRLNVAVSRARYEMLVYSTLTSGQIDLRRTNAKGVAGLKYFLEYAESGLLPMQQQETTGSKDNVMVNQIAEALRQNGFLATTNIGRSHFKIDIAVSTKEQPNKYILCIMCDGKNYYETKTTRDREIVQPSVLEMLNWNTMRVYSIDWYENRERVMQQILDQIKATGQNRKKQPADAQQEVKAFDATALQPKNTEPVVRNAGMLPYIEADISAYDVSKEDFYLRNQVSHDILLDILTVEQPVCHNYLCKRLAKSFGVGHGRAAIELIIKYSTRGCCKVKAQVGSDYYFISRKVAENYHSYRCKSPRTIGEIPQIEIENALMEVVREEFSLPVEKIPTLVAKKLGFYSAASKIKQAVSQVMELLAEQNRIVLKNDFAIMPDDLDSKV